MADFTYIHEHPWFTVGAIAGGGFILFLLLHKRSGAAVTPDATGYAAGAGAPAVDPTVAAQLAAQQAQITGQVQGLSVQGQTQIAVAQIGAGVQSQSIGATQDVTNRQTDAQLQYGLGTLGAQVASEQINASIQMRTIDAIVAAFTGNHPISNPTPTNSYPVANSTSNPISTVNPPQVVNVGTPMYDPGATPAVPVSIQPGGAVIPGGQTLIPFPNFATCDPFDSTCTGANQNLDTLYAGQVITAQAENNRNLCLQNAEANRGRPGYEAALARCG